MTLSVTSLMTANASFKGLILAEERQKRKDNVFLHSGFFLICTDLASIRKGKMTEKVT